MCKYFLYIIALYLSLFLSQNALADVDLYICKKNGETFLQDTKPTNCDTLKTYNYKTIKTPSSEANMSLKADRNYDDNYDGNANEQNSANVLWQQEQDDYYNNQCYLYDSKIKNEILEMSRRPEDGLEIRQIMSQIPKDKAQYQYYCGRPY